VSNPYRRILHGEHFDVAILFGHPRDLDSYQRDRRKKRVCVVGGGVAGLTAAFELRQQDHEVILLEASDRLGGRILTHRFEDQSYAELGPMRIPVDHHCTLWYVKLFGLRTRDFVHHNPLGWYHLRDQRRRIEKWEELVRFYPSLSSWVRSAPPEQVLGRIIDSALASLTPGDRWEIFADRFASRVPKVYEGLTLWQYLAGLSDDLLELARTTTGLPFGQPHLGAEEWEYIGRATGDLWFENASFLEWLVDAISLHNPNKLEIEGGMERLVDEFGSRLPGVVRKRARVESLAVDASGVVTTWAEGDEWRTEHFDYVICATPAPATARIRFSPRLDSRKYEALTNVSYESASKSIVHCSQRFWETEDGIFGGSSYTDLPIQQCWYPSDNARSTEGPLWASPRLNDGEDWVNMAPQRWVARDADLSREPGAFTASYLWGTNARRFASLTDAERTELVLRSIEKLHPHIRDVVDRDPVHYSWDAATNPAGGAFAFFRPGEHARYQEALSAPVPHDQPRIFFAGEHIAIAHAWIQGAIQTALSAVIDVLEAP
jgi:monoamine oxidase